MATTIFVAGPTRIDIDADGSYGTLGYSDNDNLPSVQFTDNHHEVKSVLTGNVPAALVMTGTSARITLALVKWENSELALLLAKQRGAYNDSTVGRQLVSGGFTFKVKIIGNQTYTFERCYLQPESMGDSQWGNRERILTLNIMAIPNSSGVLYTLA